jgi:hypothetical protein
MPTLPIVDFLNRVVSAFGVSATVEVEETADGPPSTWPATKPSCSCVTR